ncbi:MAG: amidohydrolase family protein [Sinobacteraceae bacterium]|nr:amidohydrolase family protein [Nevskiaceae bacterium]
MAPVNTVLTDHAVAIRDGRIVALGPLTLLEQRLRAGEIIRRPNHALLPGLVNAHSACALTALRGLPVQPPRARWRRETVEPLLQRWSSPDLVRDGLLLAMADMLRAGVTAFADTGEFPEAAARAAATLRMRAAIGLPIADVPGRTADSATAYLAQAERLWDSYRDHPWVALYFAPQDANDISDETLTRVRRIADELDARIAMPVQESDLMVLDCLSRHGRRPLQRLEELGLLRPGFAAINMTRVLPQDCALAARNGIQVIACTHSDLRLGSGACPVYLLDKAGVSVGFGSGDPVSAGGFDVLAEARTAALLVSGTSNGSEFLPAADALRMATLGGAQALGLGSTIGSIEIGKMADLTCVQLQSAAAVAERVPETLLYEGTVRQVTDVWTSGRAAVSAGELLGYDAQQLDALLESWTRRLYPGVTA